MSASLWAHEQGPKLAVDLSLGIVAKWEALPTVYEKHMVSKNILDKISVWKGDITKLQVDAIVNAADSALCGGGGVDGAIHRAAGEKALQAECSQFDGCDVGDAVITSGCGIQHIKKIIHTVGPRMRRNRDPSKDEQKELRSCYAESLRLLLQNDLRTIAFCCISTGIYGFPNGEAAYLAGNYLCGFLKDNDEQIDRIVICVSRDEDLRLYNEYFDDYFKKYREKKLKRARKAAEREEKEAAERKKAREAEEAVEKETPSSEQGKPKEEKEKEAPTEETPKFRLISHIRNVKNCFIDLFHGIISPLGTA